MGRRPCCAKEGLNRGTWTALEDKILSNYIQLHGEGKWRDLPQRAGLMRCGKSCRLRWMNYLKPGIKRGDISMDEEELIIRLHNLLGNRWSLIAARLPGRTDNEIKNYWNTHLCKKVNEGEKQDEDPNKLRLDRSGRHRTETPGQLLHRPKHVNGHQVIRTKATRCTGLIFPHKLEAEPDAGKANSSSNHAGTGETPSSSSSSSLVRQTTDVSSDFLADFKIDDILTSNARDQDLDLHEEETIKDVNRYPFDFKIFTAGVEVGSFGEFENWEADELFHSYGAFDFNEFGLFS